MAINHLCIYISKNFLMRSQQKAGLFLFLHKSKNVLRQIAVSVKELYTVSGISLRYIGLTQYRERKNAMNDNQANINSFPDSMDEASADPAVVAA